MSEGFDLYVIALIASVTALFVVYFWHVFREMRLYLGGISAFIDSRAARQRAALEREALYGRPSVLRRAGQFACITLLVALCAYLVIRKFNLI